MVPELPIVQIAYRLYDYLLRTTCTCYGSIYLVPVNLLGHSQSELPTLLMSPFEGASASAGIIAFRNV